MHQFMNSLLFLFFDRHSSRLSFGGLQLYIISYAIHLFLCHEQSQLTNSSYDFLYFAKVYNLRLGTQDCCTHLRQCNACSAISVIEMKLVMYYSYEIISILNGVRQKSILSLQKKTQPYNTLKFILTIFKVGPTFVTFKIWVFVIIDG